MGETKNDLKGILGGDSSLSPDGLAYARAIRDHIEKREASEDLRVDGRPAPPAMVLTGTLRRYAQMASVICGEDGGSPQVERRGTPSAEGGPTPHLGADGGDRADGSTVGSTGGGRAVGTTSLPGDSLHLPYPAAAQRRGRPRISLQLHRLNELCAGKLDSLSYEQMQQGHPREYEARSADKLHYRYPGVGGESYMDLILRLDSVILQLEQTRGNAIVVCDRAVCRVLVGYFERFGKAGAALDELPHMDVQGGVIELRRSHSGFSVSHTPIDVGKTTTVAGPGTDRSVGQRSNIRKLYL